MPIKAGPSYTSDHKVSEDGSISFACSLDQREWRWLALPPSHPIFIQTLNYYISVECSAARGQLDPTKWSALTWMDWEMGDGNAELPVRGTMVNREGGDKLGFAISLYDCEDRLVYRAGGKGVVFRNRNFEGWRSEAKEKLHAGRTPPAFTFAPREAVGALEGENSLIAALPPKADQTQALVTDANGMPPGSRYLDGSGDHVNAVHLAEAGRQFCALLTGNADPVISGGEIEFSRYVEMNVPFQISLVSQSSGEFRLQVDQVGKPCTSMIYRIATNPA